MFIYNRYKYVLGMYSISTVDFVYRIVSIALFFFVLSTYVTLRTETELKIFLQKVTDAKNKLIRLIVEIRSML